MLANIFIPAGVGIKSIDVRRPRDEASNITIGFYSKDELPITDATMQPGGGNISNPYPPKNPTAFQARDAAFKIWVDGSWNWGGHVFPMAKAEVQYFPTHAAVLFATNLDQPYNTSVDLVFDRVLPHDALPAGHLRTEFSFIS